MDVSSAIAEVIFAYLLMAVIAALVAVVIRGIVVALQKKGPAAPKPAAATAVSVSVTPERDLGAEHAAAIAAAVYAVLGAHRLVHIGEAPRGGVAWTAAMRSRLHTSHTPRHDHR